MGLRNAHNDAKYRGRPRGAKTCTACRRELDESCGFERAIATGNNLGSKATLRSFNIFRS